MTQIPGRHAIEISDGISPYRRLHADAHSSELRLGPSPPNLNSSRSLDAMATDEQLKAFIARHRELLEKEREAERERKRKEKEEKEEGSKTQVRCISRGTLSNAMRDQTLHSGSPSRLSAV